MLANYRGGLDGLVNFGVGFIGAYILLIIFAYGTWLFPALLHQAPGHFMIPGGGLLWWSSNFVPTAVVTTLFIWGWHPVSFYHGWLIKKLKPLGFVLLWAIVFGGLYTYHRIEFADRYQHSLTAIEEKADAKDLYKNHLIPLMSASLGIANLNRGFDKADFPHLVRKAKIDLFGTTAVSNEEFSDRIEEIIRAYKSPWDKPATNVIADKQVVAFRKAMSIMF